jgi:hypothetical protein
MAGGISDEVLLGWMERMHAALVAIEARVTALDDYLRGSGKGGQAQPDSDVRRWARDLADKANALRADPPSTQPWKGMTRTEIAAIKPDPYGPPSSQVQPAPSIGDAWNAGETVSFELPTGKRVR